VILVLDMSSSMRQPAGDGRAKYEAVTEAARGFARVVLGDEAPHRMAVVGFNDSAWREQDWSSEADEIEAAIQRLPERIAEGTRIDLAIEEATSVALGAGRRPAAELVTILLTDGMPNRVPAAPDGSPRTTVLARAASLKAAGSRVMTIGYGRPEQLDEILLRGVASRPEDFLHAPSARELDALYARLAARVRCGGG
jgi:Mg-chelatase subunit ChlD